jgi:hypothetical protein
MAVVRLLPCKTGVRNKSSNRPQCHGIIPHSNILLAMGAATLSMKAVRTGRQVGRQNASGYSEFGGSALQICDKARIFFRRISPDQGAKPSRTASNALSDLCTTTERERRRRFGMTALRQPGLLHSPSAVGRSRPAGVFRRTFPARCRRTLFVPDRLNLSKSSAQLCEKANGGRIASAFANKRFGDWPQPAALAAPRTASRHSLFALPALA